MGKKGIARRRHSGRETLENEREEGWEGDNQEQREEKLVEGV